MSHFEQCVGGDRLVVVQSEGSPKLQILQDSAPLLRHDSLLRTKTHPHFSAQWTLAFKTLNRPTGLSTHNSHH